MGHDKKLLNRCWKSTFILKLLKVQVKPHFGRFSQRNVFKNKSRGAGIMLVLRLAPLIHSRWIHAVRSLHVQLEPQQVFGSSSFFMLWSCCQAITQQQPKVCWTTRISCTWCHLSFCFHFNGQIILGLGGDKSSGMLCSFFQIKTSRRMRLPIIPQGLFYNSCLPCITEQPCCFLGSCYKEMFTRVSVTWWKPPTLSRGNR